MFKVYNLKYNNKYIFLKQKLELKNEFLKGNLKKEKKFLMLNNFDKCYDYSNFESNINLLNNNFDFNKDNINYQNKIYFKNNKDFSLKKMKINF